MLSEYIDEALKCALYEIIEDEEPYYGEIPQIKGVWASGETLEECRANLKETLDNWILLAVRRSLYIPPINGYEVRVPQVEEVA